MMPWRVEEGAGCEGATPWAVVAEEDGSTVGCHESKETAEEQLRALYANVEENLSRFGWGEDLEIVDGEVRPKAPKAAYAGKRKARQKRQYRYKQMLRQNDEQRFSLGVVYPVDEVDS